ncbi:class I adenylate-forming enzyme family protein [Rhabdothermincola salaria]|uniref:class I adenylate-forming enzyme family protein n=1 Tax=Rhabdothermincola salaria TaxID=2903142 RepID=UPI001E51627E|nr:AMP-binding protein [Rhabdothermincola salaria]MCD9625162.1 AMP-binding protein [Rhabdothermincola salaria]
MTFEEAVAYVTGPGGPLEIVDADVAGTPQKVFAATPPTLRALWDTLRARGDAPYLVYEDEQWSFADVVAQIDALGALLVDRYGVTKGDRVAIAMRNYPEWITAFAAITSIGAVAVSLNAWWTGPELEYGLTDSGAKVVVGDLPRIGRVADRLADLGVAGLAVRAEGEVPAGVDRLEDVLVTGAPLPQVDIGPDDDATILYTSGTTGRPKGAVSTNRAVLTGLMGFACRSVVEMLRTDRDEPHPFPTTFVLVVPLFHVTGCVPVMLGSALAGHKLVMMHKWDPARALELIERERVTNFIGVPTMAADLLACPDFATRDTSSLSNVGGGGAPMAPGLVKRIEDSFGTARPQLGYGMTETNAYGPSNTGDDYVRKPASTGRLVPIMDVKVVGTAGEDLPVGEVGEVCFRGANLIRGYWNRPEATAESITDGWLHTGDLGYLDDEGFVFLVDRAKDMVLRAGENVYCAEVEAAIYEHPAVHEAAVFGLPHERLGEEVACALQPKVGMAIDTDELSDFLAERIARFMVPTQWFVSDEPLPRGATGKILKREIKDNVLAAG